MKNQRTNDSRLQRQETSRRRAVGEADEEEEQQGRSRGWPRAAAATPHVGLRNVENYALCVVQGEQRRRGSGWLAAGARSGTLFVLALGCSGSWWRRGGSIYNARGPELLLQAAPLVPISHSHEGGGGRKSIVKARTVCGRTRNGVGHTVRS